MSTDDTTTAKRYRCQFYYKMGYDFADCIEAAEAVEGITEEEVISRAFQVWAERLELSAQHARKLAEATVGLHLDAEGDNNFAGLYATDEESEAVLDQLVVDGVLVEDDDEDDDDDDDDDDEDDEDGDADDDRLDATNYEFWSPAVGAPVSDYNVFLAESLDEARQVLRRWACDDKVIVAMLPAPIGEVRWHDPDSQEVIALFPNTLAKDDLIERYVAFLVEGN